MNSLPRLPLEHLAPLIARLTGCDRTRANMKLAARVFYQSSLDQPSDWHPTLVIQRLSQEGAASLACFVTRCQPQFAAVDPKTVRLVFDALGPAGLEIILLPHCRERLVELNLGQLESSSFMIAMQEVAEWRLPAMASLTTLRRLLLPPNRCIWPFSLPPQLLELDITTEDETDTPELGAALLQLTALSRLTLREYSLPPCLRQLSSLRELVTTACSGFEHVPPQVTLLDIGDDCELDQLQPVTALRSLQALWFGGIIDLGVLLEELPDLSGLTALWELDLEGSKIAAGMDHARLPASLTSLRLPAHLSAVPPSLRQLTNLQSLIFGEDDAICSGFEALPTSLTYLYIRFGLGVEVMPVYTEEGAVHSCTCPGVSPSKQAKQQQQQLQQGGLQVERWQQFGWLLEPKVLSHLPRLKSIDIPPDAVKGPAWQVKDNDVVPLDPSAIWFSVEGPWPVDHASRPVDGTRFH